mmetsp:Transcript_6367/g.26763  ORF Transcript_6367/g.26763 Transcript_6367/m.26763 type:complete len:350 (-) Transcript_6367:1145-2194(-)
MTLRGGSSHTPNAARSSWRLSVVGRALLGLRDVTSYKKRASWGKLEPTRNWCGTTLRRNTTQDAIRPCPPRDGLPRRRRGVLDPDDDRSRRVGQSINPTHGARPAPPPVSSSSFSLASSSPSATRSSGKSHLRVAGLSRASWILVTSLWRSFCSLASSRMRSLIGTSLEYWNWAWRTRFARSRVQSSSASGAAPAASMWPSASSAGTPGRSTGTTRSLCGRWSRSSRSSGICAYPRRRWPVVVAVGRAPPPPGGVRDDDDLDPGAPPPIVVVPAVLVASSSPCAENAPTPDRGVAGSDDPGVPTPEKPDADSAACVLGSYSSRTSRWSTALAVRMGAIEKAWLNARRLP